MIAATLSGLAVLSGLGACVTGAAYTARIEAALPPSGERVTVDGYEMHVVRAGTDGPLVMMIHGASANAREWQATLGPRLDTQARLMMVDRPGHGYSERFAGAESLGAQARAVAGVLDQLAPGEPAILVGHSFGGAVALRVALDRPDLASGLVLLAPVTHDWGSGGTSWYNQAASPPFIGHAFAQLVPLVGPAQAQAGIDSVFEPAPAPEDYYDSAGLGLLFRPKHFRANARDLTVLKAELAAQSARYGDLDLPIIVFSGAGDTVLSPKLHVGRLKHQTTIELIALPDEGHMPHHGEGLAVADAILRLAQVQKPR